MTKLDDELKYSVFHVPMFLQRLKLGNDDEYDGFNEEPENDRRPLLYM
jgi:hypothetical protein